MRANYNSLIFVLIVSVVGGCSSDSVPKLGDACASQTECFAGDRLSCNDGRCLVQTCRETSGCPDGSACVDGACGPAQCIESADCDDGERCWEGACRDDLCESAQSCGDGEVCRGGPPLCQTPPETCETDRDCLAGFACDRRTTTCVPPCQTSSDCDGTDVCRRGFCSVPCISSNDCITGDLCFAGNCIESNCADTSCVGEVNPLTCQCVECFNDSQCESDKACNDSGICTGCSERRETSAECDALGLFFQSGCCAQCLTDLHCPGRLVCSAGVCSEPPSVDCVRDSDCENSQSCDGGLCVRLGSNASCTQQTDCVDQEACYPDGRCHPRSDVCEECDFRCVASTTDDVGACVGCANHCEAAGCAQGQTCVIRDGGIEGACIDSDFSGCP